MHICFLRLGVSLGQSWFGVHTEQQPKIKVMFEAWIYNEIQKKNLNIFYW